MRIVLKGASVASQDDAELAAKWAEHTQHAADGRLWIRVSLQLAVIPAIGLVVRALALLRDAHAHVTWQPLVVITCLLGLVVALGYLFVRSRAKRAQAYLGSLGATNH
jgi:hypothetical protein